MKRRVTQYSSLTSLLDVLFILLFASLARATGVMQDQTAAAATESAVAPEPAPALEPTPPPDARAPTPVPERSRVELKSEAVAALARSLESRRPVFVRISGDGEVTSIDVGTSAGAEDRPVGVPLLERVPDPDIGISYLGDRTADLRVCNIVMHHLQRTDLRDDLIIIAPEVALQDLPVALVVGLQRDQERCSRDAQGIAIVIDPLLESPPLKQAP